MTLAPPSTFNAPLLDGSLDILQIIEHQGRNSAQHPLFRYANANGAIETILWGSAAKAFDVASRFVLENAVFKAVDNTGEPPVVGILANLDSMTFYAMVVGIMKAGFTVFPISTRNSPDGVAHLLAKTSCKFLFISGDAVVARLAETSCSILEAKNDDHQVSTAVVPPFDYFYNNNGDNDAMVTKSVPSRVILDQATPCVIIHSSGTVSFPKPITLTYQMFFEHGNQVRLEGDLCGHIISAHGMPMYHLMGLKVIAYTALFGVTLAVFRPSTPPITPTSEEVLSGAIATSSSRIFCAPLFLENWAKQKANINALKGFTAVMFGGGPIQATVGDYLAKEGVTLVPMLGMTEVGTITSFFPKHTHSEGWEWFALDPNLNFTFIPEEGVENLYRFIVKQNAFKTLAVVNTTVDGVPAYDTGDLFIQHPTGIQLWKIYGRADEQIMHSSGEKTNPVPIEAGLIRSPYISAALMFGRARFRVGVLIAPSPKYAFDTADAEKTTQYINLIWDTVQEVNRQSPQHSRIFKEMIIIASPDKQFDYTTKGSLRRQVTLNKYEEEIECLYKEPESVDSDKIPPSALPQGKAPEVNDFLPLVRSAVHEILSDSMGDEDDIFQAGADSLCTLSIRNSIVSGLRESQAISHRSIEALPEDLLYYLPTIAKLSIFLYGVACIDNISQHTNTDPNAPETDDKTDKLLQNVYNEKWQKIMESKETVVEIAEGHGENALIIIHGAPGTIATFKPMLHSPTAIWAVQMLDHTPTDTLESLTAFYYQKIKEKQPNGPYRLGSYSGSCVVLLELVTTFEQNGDEVIQFVMLDHFPAIFLLLIDLDTVELDNPEWWKPIIDHSLAGMQVILENTQGPMATQVKFYAQQVLDAVNGLPATPFATLFIKNATRLTKATLKFLLGERFAVEDPKTGRKRFSSERFGLYASKIKARLTVYICTAGLRALVPPSKCEDLGSREFFPDVTLREIESGHIDILGSEVLMNSLGIDY